MLRSRLVGRQGERRALNKLLKSGKVHPLPGPKYPKAGEAIQFKDDNGWQVATGNMHR